MSSHSERAAGLLIGLAAGDKNGGPQRLALLLAHSVFINKTFDIKHIWNSYAKWYKKGGFDTGHTFVTVYKMLQQNNALTPKHVSQSIYTDAIKNKQSPSVGIGSTHRAAVLSMFPFLMAPFETNNSETDDKDKQDKEEKKSVEETQIIKLEDVVFEESCLTHYAPLSRNCSIAVNYICRALIIGYEWIDALKVCYKYMEDDQIKKILLIFIENKNEINENNYRLKLGMGGYALEVLQAALYFLNEYDTFDAALTASIKFAGSANYCPVLVGSIGGAKYGMNDVINSTHFKHKQNRKLISKDAISASIDTKEFKDKKMSDFEVSLSTQVGALWNTSI